MKIPLSFNDVPKKYNYIAINKSGNAYAYKYKPWIDHSEEWCYPTGLPYKFIAGGFDSTNWKESLMCKEGLENSNKYELKRLDVNDIPKNYNWAAVDFNGKAYAFAEKPSCDGVDFDYEYFDNDDYDPEIANYCKVWKSDKEKVLIGKGYNPENWEKSLIFCESTTNNEIVSNVLSKIPEIKDAQLKLTFNKYTEYISLMQKKCSEGLKTYEEITVNIIRILK